MKQQLKLGSDYYLNEEGLVVFTEKYHLEKGYCCGMGCKHCPYNYVNVNEQERAQKLAERENLKKDSC
jgi:hypothetical protein